MASRTGGDADMSEESAASFGRIADKIESARARFWAELDEESRATQRLRELADSLRAERAAEMTANVSQSSRATSIDQGAP